MKLYRWLYRITRPVLGPLRLSILARILDQLAGITLLSGAAWYAVLLIGQQVQPGLFNIAGLVIVMIVLALVKAWLRYEEQYRGHLVAFRSLELLRTEAFSKLYPQAPAVLQTAHTGEVFASVTKDIDRIEVFFAHTIAPAISAIIVPLIVFVTVSLFATTQLAVAGIVVCIVATALAWIFGTIGTRSQSLLQTRREVSHHMVDSVQGAREILGYQQEVNRTAELQALNNKVHAHLLTETAWTTATKFLVQATQLALPGVLLWVGYQQYLDGQVSLAILVGTIVAYVRTWEVVQGVQEFSLAVQVSLGAARRVYSLTHQEPAVPVEGKNFTDLYAKADKSKGIVWDNVTVVTKETATKPAVTILSAASTVVPLGAWTTIVGVTGSGKTSLANLLIRNVDPTSGSIAIAGIPLRDVTPESLRDNVVLVPQSTELFSGTIATNLRVANPTASEEAMWEVLDLVALTEEIHQLDGGLNAILTEAGGSLSGGQRQRLGLARALLKQPEILILDEYAAHLNPQLEQTIRANLLTHMAGKTIIEISHNIGAARQADFIVVVAAGGVAESGKRAELEVSEGPYSLLVKRWLNAEVR